MAKLSIIMVSYNEKDYIAEAIESVIAQSFTDWELIIGDDGSNDGTLEIIKNYKDKYPEKIKFYTMNRNDGITVPSARVSNNLKHGFKIASGSYLSVLDGDDFFISTKKFENEISFLDNNKNYVATVSDFKYVFDASERNYVIRNFGRCNFFWACEYSHLSCFTFRKECLLKLINNFFDDTGMAFSIALAGKWKYTRSVDFAYRQRNDGIMKKTSSIKLCILELLLYNQILSKTKKYRVASLSRFYKPMRCVFKNRDKINMEIDSYADYLKYDICGLITNLLNYDRLKLSLKIKYKKMMLCAFVSYVFFGCLKKVGKLFFMIFRRKTWK